MIQLFGGVPTAAAPDTFDAVTNATYTNEAFSSKTISHTTSGSDRYLLVYTAALDNGSPEAVAGITYNGVALSFLATSGIGDELWGLVAPASGANNLVISFSGGTSKSLALSILSFTGVHQSSPIGTPDGRFAADTSPTSVLSGTVSGGVVVGGCFVYQNGAAAPTISLNSGTQRSSLTIPDSSDGDFALSTGTKSSPSSSINWTLSETPPDVWGTCAVELKPV